jgi:DUF1680 family protein
MYLTGGCGPSRHDETAYAETCATIGLMLWNSRLLQFNGDRKYADVVERGLYNGFLKRGRAVGAPFRRKRSSD